MHQSPHHKSLHQEPLQIMALIVLIKKTHTGSMQSLSFQILRGCFFSPQTNLLTCLFLYHCYIQASIFTNVVPACAISNCMERPAITAVSILQDRELIISKHIHLSQRMLFLQCSNSLSVKVYFKRYACIIQICKILSCTRPDIFLLWEKKKEDSVSLYPCFFKIHSS